ncbi:MAG: BlaI/MecI/CopY family transcriptional regulator [Planctomycetaceae bacterium]|nr:BlaI/MecI/CopY family transcriptional regulator [Planctomycetaceae bacterium]
MPKKSNKPATPTISPAEWEIMETFWRHGPLAARDVFAQLPAEKSRDIKTVRTLLSRLVEKGALGYDQIGNSYLYRAEYTRDQLICGEVRSVANRVLDGSVSALFANFIREEELTPAEIKQLRQLLDEKARLS